MQNICNIVTKQQFYFFLSQLRIYFVFVVSHTYTSLSFVYFLSFSISCFHFYLKKLNWTQANMHIYVFENFKNSVSSATTFEAFVFIESINSSARIKKSNKSEHLPQIQKQFYGWLAFWLVIIVVACYNRRIKKKC